MFHLFKSTAIVVKTTVIGGILFMVPIITLIIIIGKGYVIAIKLLTPVTGALGVQTMSGFAVVKLLAVFVLVLICFVAGLVAKSRFAKKFMKSLEGTVLEKVPLYELLKAKTVSTLDSDDVEEIGAVMVRFEDAWHLALEIERIEDGKAVIYLPGAPNPWSGSVCIVTEDRISPLKFKTTKAIKLMKRFGKGTGKFLSKPPGLRKESA
jgi:uncharacterized membrane protein